MSTSKWGDQQISNIYQLWNIYVTYKKNIYFHLINIVALDKFTKIKSYKSDI